MDPLKRVLTREVEIQIKSTKFKQKKLRKVEKSILCLQVSRIDLQEGELYAQHYDQRKELGR